MRLGCDADQARTNQQIVLGNQSEPRVVSTHDVYDIEDEAICSQAACEANPFWGLVSTLCGPRGNNI